MESNNNIANHFAENPNDSIEELFNYEIERGIDYGNINIIKKAISNYSHLLNNEYIVWANNIITQIVTEQIDEMQI